MAYNEKRKISKIDELREKDYMNTKVIVEPEYSDSLYATIAHQSIDEIIELRATKRKNSDTIHVTSCIDLKWEDWQRTSFKGTNKWAQIVSMYNHFSSKYKYEPITLVECTWREYNARNKV